MKIVYAMLHSFYLRNLESTIRLLAERGHTIHFSFAQEDSADRPGKIESVRLLEKLLHDYPTFSYEMAPPADDTGSFLAKSLRLFADYLRYLHPRYENAPKLRARYETAFPPVLLGLLKIPGARTPAGLQRLTRFIQWLEDAVPVRSHVLECLQSQQPDVVLVTPLVDNLTTQKDFIKAAKQRGIPTGLCVYSWDNLTNKGLIHPIPDRVTVWNDFQKQEAIELHGVAPDQIVVTGAACYDHWFTWQPSSSRTEFCQKIGLDPEQPYILYLCSSGFIAPDEVSFVDRWIREVRSASALSQVGVLIRPHPQNVRQWQSADLSHHANVTIYPALGANPIDAESRISYFDSMYHSVAVVGINTSAQIEAGILQRPVYTILDPQFTNTQTGTLHFQHLVQANGGLLNLASDFDQHRQQLSEALQGDPGLAQRSEEFIKAFVRPHGLETAAAPLMATAIEQLAARSAAASAERRSSETVLGNSLLRPFLYVLAQILTRSWEQQQAKLKPAKTPKSSKKPKKAKKPSTKELA